MNDMRISKDNSVASWSEFKLSPKDEKICSSEVSFEKWMDNIVKDTEYKHDDKDDVLDLELFDDVKVDISNEYLKAQKQQFKASFN